MFKKILIFICSCFFTELAASSVSDNGDYPEFCQKAANDEKIFSSFRRNPNCLAIVETVTECQGQEYLNVIKSEYSELICHFSKFKENDCIGDPITFDYPPFGKFSPTTLRYIKVAGEIRKLFGDISNLHIVEIGGGYGGQCKILSDLCGFASYTIIDLPKANSLAKKYLQKGGVKGVVFIDCNTIPSLGHFDLVISNYALCEIDKRNQILYINKLLKQIPNGYMTWSKIYNQSFTVENFAEILKKYHPAMHLNIEIEKPLTAPGNTLLFWRN